MIKNEKLIEKIQDIVQGFCKSEAELNRLSESLYKLFLEWQRLKTE